MTDVVAPSRDCVLLVLCGLYGGVKRIAERIEEASHKGLPLLLCVNQTGYCLHPASAQQGLPFEAASAAKEGQTAKSQQCDRRGLWHDI